MNNAFTILGAEPTDNAERLQELLDEKELLLDDISEVQAAYADLTNPKKRLMHEIAYFSSASFEDFNKLINHSFEDKPLAGNIAKILVGIGWWFESSDDALFNNINASRSKSGFVLIDDADTVIQTVQTFKQDCIQSINTYFDSLTEKSLVNIFNQIVKISHFDSFFIDELMSYYELKISESLQNKEKKCTAVFNEIEKLCNQFNNGGTLSPLISGKVTEFSTALKDWDNYAQPLQVNMQKRGGQHNSSSALVHDIRNRIIDLSNNSQEIISRMLKSLEFLSRDNMMQALNDPVALERYKLGLAARELLPKQLSDGVKLANYILQLIDILSEVFEELEVTAEQLKEDKKTLIGLRDTLSNLNKQIQEAKREGERRAQSTNQMGGSTSSSDDDCCGGCCNELCGGCYVATCVYGSYDCPEVWTLRRYRDKTLGSTWYGRLFIRLYYAISPTIVKWFGKTKWFKKMWKGVLDKKVKRLQDKGFEDTPYQDIDWRK